MNTMHVEDFVVLGRTVPEDSKKYGQRVCMAGYSRQNNQFIRIYPLLVPIGGNADANRFQARRMYSVDLRRNPNDSRTESWRVADEHKPTSTPWGVAPEVKTEDVVAWLRQRRATSIANLNDCRMSLGVLFLDPEDWDGEMVPRDEALRDDDTPDLFANFDEREIDPELIRWVPYIRFCAGGVWHRLQVREWGAYRLLANPDYADDRDALWSAPGYREGKGLAIVIGNMCNRRNNWLVIKTFEIDCRPSGDLGLLAFLNELA